MIIAASTLIRSRAVRWTGTSLPRRRPHEQVDPTSFTEQEDGFAARALEDLTIFIILNVIIAREGWPEARMKIKVTTVGNSAGVVLPKEVLAKLRVQKGDALYLRETQDGIELSPYDPEFDREMAMARAVMRRYRNALRKLAR
jgi:putative addiction module antidote